MELKSYHQGRCNMSYYSKTIYPFVEKLIRSHNQDAGVELYELSVSDLELDEQHEFARHLMVQDGENLSCIYDNESHSSIYESLLNLLQHGDAESKIDFSDLISEKLVEFYTPKMQSIIDDAIGWVEQEDMEEAGYSSSKDKVNGETIWLRKTA